MERRRFTTAQQIEKYYIGNDIRRVRKAKEIFILVLSKANLVNKAKSEGSNFKDENLVTAISRVKVIEFSVRKK